jgi:PTH1 family peptidyl-tRNA hydrolase
MSIAVIAGLGNPGSKYRNTRHNVGFAVVEKLAAKLGAEWKTETRFEAEIATVSDQGRKLLLVKPQTFMNASGRSLGAILRYRKLPTSSLVAIYDDITLELGRAKLSWVGAPVATKGLPICSRRLVQVFFAIVSELVRNHTKKWTSQITS